MLKKDGKRTHYELTTKDAVVEVYLKKSRANKQDLNPLQISSFEERQMSAAVFPNLNTFFQPVQTDGQIDPYLIIEDLLNGPDIF